MEDFTAALFLMLLLAFGLAGLVIIADDRSFKCTQYDYQADRCKVYTRKSNHE